MPNNKFSQISLFDIYEDVNTSFTEKKSELVSLLEKHIDFSSLISYEFRRAFYSNLGRKHKYHLESFIKALIIQKLFAFNLCKCDRGTCHIDTFQLLDVTKWHIPLAHTPSPSYP